MREGDLDKTEQAMESLVASVVWDEARFGLPLDLERFMIVAVGDFNMGAMENKGLNLFNTKYVLANPATATDDDYAAIESVVGHEYFHNWTGNRVTCRDWFQLSLKEGLTVFRDQEFSMDMVASPTARAVRRIEEVRALRQVQFPEDAGAMAHPVRPDSYVEINNFYTPTIYEKGAEVVRMMQTLVGREGFERGITLYFQRHDGQAVTCDDFAQAIADANPGSELATRLPQFKRWYGQAGTPRLTARGRYDAPSRTFTLGLEQSPAATAGATAREPFVIPLAIGLLTRDGREMRLRLEDEPEAAAATSRMLVLDDTKAFFTFVDVDEPPVPSLLRGFSAPVCLVDGLGDAELLILLRHDSDPFNRWEAGQRLALNRAARRGGRRRRGAARRGLRRRDARDPARARARPGVQGAGADAAERDLHRRAARQRRSAARPCGARGDEAAARAPPSSTTGSGRSMRTRSSGGYSPDPVSAGRRALANLALAMLCLAARQSGDAVWPGRAWQRFKDAGNMTDRQGALMALMASGSVLADAAFERFHAIFSERRRWCSTSGSRCRPARRSTSGKVFERVKRLLAHPDFKLANPEPRAQPDRHLLLRQPGGLPSRRRRRLRASGPTG